MEIKLSFAKDAIFPRVGDELHFGDPALLDAVVLTNHDIAKYLRELSLICSRNMPDTHQQRPVARESTSQPGFHAVVERSCEVSARIPAPMASDSVRKVILFPSSTKADMSDFPISFRRNRGVITSHRQLRRA